jgi:hypothetical protein
MIEDMERIDHLQQKIQLKGNSGMDPTKELAELTEAVFCDPDVQPAEYPFTIEELYTETTGGVLSEIPEARCIQLIHGFHIYMEQVMNKVDSYDLSTPDDVKYDAERIFCFQDKISAAYEKCSFWTDAMDEFAAGEMDNCRPEAPMREEIRRIMEHILHVAEVLEAKMDERDYAAVNTISFFYPFNNITMLGHYIERMPGIYAEQGPDV